MQKCFEMENDVGILVKYTVLGISGDDKEKYVVYTNYLPADNELGIRLFAGVIKSENPFIVDRLSKKYEKEIIESFKMEVISTGKKVRRVI